MKMNKYYYTFGTDERFPFYKGYIIINAPDMGAAHRLFRAYHPDRDDSDRCLNCASYYTEEEWGKTSMADGSWGACHAEYTYGA
jgi:hypothetical protein